ncbi:MAG: hypothetical protein M1834_003331 [Cirrosporium novae-zelandiae]|nr:MAG: hypothetical protein M1834_003331 [Cirrosporium novae-zelandiae]
MENNTVFEADANIDEEIRSRSRPISTHRGRSRRGHKVTTTVLGGVDANEGTEEAPLLSRDPRDDDSSSSNSTDSLDNLPWWKKPSVFWLLPSFALTTLAFGGLVVPRINLILTLICRQRLQERAINDPGFQFNAIILGGDNPQCNTPEIQSLVAKFTLYGNLIGGILSAVTSPKFGALSDRYGRTKLLGITTSGLIMSEVITIMVATNPEVVSYQWLLLGFALDGLSGSFAASMAITHSYATDCTPPERRNVVFGWFHGCLFSGIAFGPVLAGYIVEATGSLVKVFYVALGCHLLFVISVVFIIPDSLSRSRQMAAREKHRLKTVRGLRTDQTWADKLQITNLFVPLRVLYPTGEGSSRAVRRNLVALAAVDTTMFGVAMGSMTVVVIYAEYMFGWSNFDSSVFLSVVNICRVCNLILVLPLVTRFIRGRTTGNQRSSGMDKLDLGIIRVAIIFDTLGYIGFSTVRSGKLMILSGCLASIGGMGSPTLQSSLTKHVPPDQTGQLLGAIGLLHALARVVAPTIFNLIYSVTVGKFSQAVFVCLASTFGGAFILTGFIRPYGK